MSDKTEKKDVHDLLDSEDYEYEKEIYDKQKQEQAEIEAKRAALTEERRKREKEAKREHERQLARERIELMKQKSSAPADSTEDSNKNEQLAENQEPEEIEQEEAADNKKSFSKKADNFFYHNKWWLGMAAIILVIGGFILYNELTRKSADLTVIMIADNGLQYRQDELEEFFEEYAEDTDDNGYTHVSVQIIPLDRSNNSQTQLDNNSKFLAELQSTDIMLVITDSNTDEYYMDIMDNELKSKFPDNKYIDDKGFSLNMQLIADKLGYEEMPNDIHISIRKPVATVDDTLETAKENYDKNLKYLEKMISDLTQKAKETNDSGLSTLPKSKESSSSNAG